MFLRFHRGDVSLPHWKVIWSDPDSLRIGPYSATQRAAVSTRMWTDVTSRPEVPGTPSLPVRRIAPVSLPVAPTGLAGAPPSLAVSAEPVPRGSPLVPAPPYAAPTVLERAPECSSHTGAFPVRSRAPLPIKRGRWCAGSPPHPRRDRAPAGGAARRHAGIAPVLIVEPGKQLVRIRARASLRELRVEAPGLQLDCVQRPCVEQGGLRTACSQHSEFPAVGRRTARSRFTAKGRVSSLHDTSRQVFRPDF